MGSSQGNQAPVAPSALAVWNLSKRFGGLSVLKAVSLSVPSGERRVLIGQNGAGKSTLFNLISGTMTPDEGSIEILGKDVTTDLPRNRIRRGLGRTFQINSLFEGLTVRQGIQLSLLGISNKRFSASRAVGRVPGMSDRTEQILRGWGVADIADRTVRELPYGRQREVEIVLAMAQDPAVLLLDEPTAGLAPEQTARICEVILSLPRTTTLVIVEHDMDVAFRVADSLSVLHLGSVLRTGRPSEIRSDHAVQDAYLGVNGDEEPCD